MSSSANLLQLEVENANLHNELVAIRDQFRQSNDFRWFFTYAHAKITELILLNLSCFCDQNQILRVNRHFTKAYINAVRVSPPLEWETTFDNCRDLERRSWNPFLIGEIEQCGALMAYTHIDVDLRQALKDEGGMNPQDFSNVLIFVEKAQLYASFELRGLIGFHSYHVGNWLSPLVDVTIKHWRNTMFTETTRLEVPNIKQEFNQCINPKL